MASTSRAGTKRARASASASGEGAATSSAAPAMMETPTERTWCEQCGRRAGPRCAVSHPAALRDAFATCAGLFAEEGAAMPEGKLRDAQLCLEEARRIVDQWADTLRKQQDALDQDAPRLLIKYMGTTDRNCNGIEDGEAAVALTPARALDAAKQRTLCSLVGGELLLDQDDYGEGLLRGRCRLGAVAATFPPRPARLQLKEGAVLLNPARNQLSIYLRRLQANEEVGTRLLGYLLPEGLRALSPSRCSGCSNMKCAFCSPDYGGVKVYLKEVTYKEGS